MYYSKLYEFGYYHGLVPDIDNEQLAEIIIDHGKRESKDVADTFHEDFDFPDNEQFRKLIAYIKKEYNYIILLVYLNQILKIDCIYFEKLNNIS